MYKVLALDLDGTALNKNHAISAALRDKIHQLKDTVDVIIVTGRHHTAAYPYYLELGLNTPIVCCNGTYLYDYQQQRVLSADAIDQAQAKQFIESAQQNDLKMVMYVTDVMLFSATKPVNFLTRMSDWARTLPMDIRPKIQAVDDFMDEVSTAKHIWKFVVEGDDTDAFRALPFIQTHFNGERSWVNRIDFSRRGNNKGRRLKEYVETLGVSAEQVVAIGDNHNDLSMFEYAGLSVAMSNADPIVQQAADKITNASNQDPLALSNLLDELFND